MQAQADYYDPIQKSLEEYRLSNSESSEGKLNWTTEITSPEAYQRAETILTESLRSFVDEWLDSAKKPDGQGGYSEEPGKRSLRCKHSDGYWFYTNAYHALTQYLRSHPISAFLLDDNRIGGVFAPQTVPRTGPDDPTKQARDEAIRLFVRFMDSDFRWQLAKCYVCGTYFYPNRKIKGFYKRGIYCWKCRPEVSKRSTKASRGKWTNKVLGIAADYWLCWKESDGPRSAWITMQVNERLSPKDRRVNPWWITWNDEKIIARAMEKEEERHAAR